MAAEQLQHNLYIDVSHVSGSSEYRPGCSTCRWKGAITGRPETAAEETVLHVEGRAAERQRGTAKGDFALDPDHDLYIHASHGSVSSTYMAFCTTCPWSGGSTSAPGVAAEESKRHVEGRIMPWQEGAPLSQSERRAWASSSGAPARGSELD